MRRTFPGAETLAKIPISIALSIVLHVLTARRRPATNSTAGATTSCTTTCAASNATAGSACIYSNKDYGCEWDYDWRNKRFRTKDNTKFAVNLVVYAMT